MDASCSGDCVCIHIFMYLLYIYIYTHTHTYKYTQALTQHAVMDWVGMQRLLQQQRVCYTKLIVGQTSALHLYNDHRLPPHSLPHPAFDVSGQAFYGI